MCVCVCINDIIINESNKVMNKILIVILMKILMIILMKY